MQHIPLVQNTIPNSEIDQLIDWLKTYPRLTKGQLTIEFERQWAKWIGTDYAVFVNSGSSANLLVVAALEAAGKIKAGDKVIVPAVSWVTTVTPVMQMGFTPILCDANLDNLGIDTNHLEKLCEEHKPKALILVHVLGFPCDMHEIIRICCKYDVTLIEDSCETVGTLIGSRKAGSFGLMSTFSTYYGHHFSTIEGGLVCTNNFDIYQKLLCLRSHGWARDLAPRVQDELKKKYMVDDFHNQYTFYESGFNLRSTDLSAFLGINQLKTLDENNMQRFKNLCEYDSNLKNPLWKIKATKFQFVPNFAYPVITRRLPEAVDALKANNIDCRPLVCGSIARQPFWVDRYGKDAAAQCVNANLIHNWGMYLPNNPGMTPEDIKRICDALNPILSK